MILVSWNDWNPFINQYFICLSFSRAMLVSIGPGSQSINCPSSCPDQLSCRFGPCHPDIHHSLYYLHMLRTKKHGAVGCHFTWSFFPKILTKKQQPIVHLSMECLVNSNSHDDAIKWKHFPRYWPFVQGIYRSPLNSPHKGQWRGALMFTLICARINSSVNNREAGDLRCHCAHYDVIVMWWRDSFSASVIAVL